MNDRFFRDAFDRCPVPMWLVRAADGAIVQANDAAARLHGGDRGSPPRSRHDLPPSAAWTSLEDRGEVYLLAVLPGAPGAGKEAVDALSESENRYRTLIEQLPDHVWHKDREGRYVSCNRRYAQTRV